LYLLLLVELQNPTPKKNHKSKRKKLHKKLVIQLQIRLLKAKKIQEIETKNPNIILIL